MLVVRALLWALTNLLFVRAGEIVLYHGNTCSTSSFRIIFSANVTSNCQQRDFTSPFNYSTSTSRNIGPSCTFNLYKDTKCATLVTKIVSSGPYKSCVPLAGGVQSYKITCTGHVNAKLTRPMDDDIYSPDYFQSLDTYRGKPSGSDYFGTYLNIYGASLPTKPTGDPSAVGIKLASAFFQQVPSGVYTYTIAITDGGTLYRANITGYKGNSYTAETAARTMGFASFASLMADTAATLYRRPSTYYYFSLDNYDAGDKQMGSVNMSIVTP